MKSKIISLAIFFNVAILIASCHSASSKDAVIEKTVNTIAKTDSAKFTAIMVDNKRDPSCGMPVSAGIGDTVHYNNKVLGFCSKECKDEFLKDPVKNITAADLKK